MPKCKKVVKKSAATHRDSRGRFVSERAMEALYREDVWKWSCSVLDVMSK